MAFDAMDPHHAPVNPYQAPSTAIDAEEAPATFDLTRQEVEAFVGPDRADYYYRKWQRARLGALFAGWNFGAGFFNLAWMLYRRMFREFFIALGVAAVLGVGETLITSYVVGAEFEREVSRVGDLLIAIATAIFGNAIYLRRARKKVAQARAQLPEGGEGRLAYLRTLGGTSWLAVVIGMACMVAFAVAMASLPD